MKAGDYVRTKYGIIGKIENKNFIGYNDWIIDTLYYQDDEIIKDWTCGIKEYDIIKSSPNIIDLIEVGDYVNGDRVKALKGDIESHKINNEEDVLYTEYINDYDKWCGYEEDEIKSIVTHEQFESMQYKVGE